MPTMPPAHGPKRATVMHVPWRVPGVLCVLHVQSFSLPVEGQRRQGPAPRQEKLCACDVERQRERNRQRAAYFPFIPLSVSSSLTQRPHKRHFYNKISPGRPP